MPSLYRIKVHAGAREDRLSRLGPDRFEAWVRAEPERGLANAAVLALLAARLDLEPKRLRIVKGATSPANIVAVLGKA